MTLEQFAYVGELVAALAVVLSLVYLARQVTQNNKLLAAQARYNLISLRADIATSITDQYILEALHKYASGKDFSAAEKSAALTMAARVLEMWQWQYKEHKAGMLELEELPVGVWVLMYYGKSEIPIPLQETWARRRDVMDPGFARFMKEYVVSEDQ